MPCPAKHNFKLMANISKSPRKTKIAKSAAPVAASVFDYILPLAGGAIVTMLVLALLHFGANEIWSPFERTGANVFKGLATSAMAGGIATAVLGRRFHGPLAATACALGWALWGLGLHFGAQGQYLAITGDGFPDGARARLVFSNAISQSLSVAFALIVASAISWFWARRRKDVADEAPVNDDDLDGNGLKSFSTAFVYPLSTVIGGVFALMILGVLALPMGDPPLEQLPSGPAVAALCGALTMLALFIATYAARRAFRALGSSGDVILAPLVIAFVAGMFLAAQFQMPIMNPAALLIWRTSAFELSSWAALGAGLGYYFARSKMKIQ